VRKISIIVPALNEEGAIKSVLDALQPARAEGHEVIVVDGGSADRTIAVAASAADHVIEAARGRARQMNAGAAAASGEIFWFLHADTRPPRNAIQLIQDSWRDKADGWGRFDVRLSGAHPLLRVVERMMNWRSRLTGIATGDQGMFVTRGLFEAAGCFPDLPLMEDIAFSCALKRHGKPMCLSQQVETSSRRWERDGVLRTVMLMWRLRLAYALGADPNELARSYYGDRALDQ
jgi:rSAM/selenodomain-associated transferase 2